jgi:hypothetical protein
MSTPAEKIADAAASIPATLEGMDPLTRVRALTDATEAVADLRADVALLRATAMRAYVDQVGASRAGRELGLSRGRVYQLLADK